MSLEAVVMLLGLVANLLAVIGYSNKHEARLTRVETLISVMMKRNHITPRAEDLVHDEE